MDQMDESILCGESLRKQVVIGFPTRTQKKHYSMNHGESGARQRANHYTHYKAGLSDLEFDK